MRGAGVSGSRWGCSSGSRARIEALAGEAGPAAARWVSADAVIFLEMPKPAALIDRLTDERLLGPLSSIPSVKAALESDKVRQIKDVADLVAGKLGKSPEEALRDLTGGGLVLRRRGRRGQAASVPPHRDAFRPRAAQEGQRGAARTGTQGRDGEGEARPDQADRLPGRHRLFGRAEGGVRHRRGPPRDRRPRRDGQGGDRPGARRDGREGLVRRHARMVVPPGRREARHPGLGVRPAGTAPQARPQAVRRRRRGEASAAGDDPAGRLGRGGAQGPLGRGDVRLERPSGWPPS